jgi:hypothetical protein
MKWTTLIIIGSLFFCSGCGSVADNSARLTGNDLDQGVAALRIQGVDDAARWVDEVARWADDPARREADDAATWVDDAARRGAEEAEEAAPRIDDTAWQGVDEAVRASDAFVATRSDDLVGKIMEGSGYVQEGGCLIVNYAAKEGPPPPPAWINDYVVYKDVPEVDIVDNEIRVDNDIRVEKQLMEIDLTLWAALLSAEEHEDYLEVLYEVNQACEAADALRYVLEQS